jgi:hypothetical protein
VNTLTVTSAAVLSSCLFYLFQNWMRKHLIPELVVAIDLLILAFAIGLAIGAMT